MKAFWLILAEWLKREPVVVGELTKIVVAAGLLFGLPLDPLTASVVAGLAYTALTFLVRQFTTSETVAAEREKVALNTPVPGE